MVSWSSALLGNIVDHHNRLIVCHTVPVVVMWGIPHQNTAAYSDIPFGAQIHQLSFQIGLVNPVLIINLEDYIFNTFSLFCCIIGSNSSVIVVLDSTASDLELCPVHFQ